MSISTPTGRASRSIRPKRRRKARHQEPRRSHLSRRFEQLEDRRLLAVYSSGDIPKTIPDQSTVLSTLSVPDAVTVGDVNVSLDISHGRAQDLDVFLRAPDGSQVELFTDVGGGGDNFSGTTLDDEAAMAVVDGSAPFSGSYRPEGLLADFDGKLAQGTWTLEVNDDKKRESGVLNSWSIEVTGSQPSLAIDDVQLDEGDAGTTSLMFTVTRNGATGGISSVDFTTADGTATAGSDYSSAAGTLTFLSGVTSQTITVNINGDVSVELDESFVVNLSNPANATITDAQGLGTILDDDGHPIPNDTYFSDQHALNNTGQTGAFDADIDMPAAWSVTTGNLATVVAVLDTGVNYAHEELYLNMYLNQGEIPTSLSTQLNDTDADGLITFHDLNDVVNASFVSDLNGNSYIDAGDLLADATWENDIDEDGNGLADDLVGWDFHDNDNDPYDAVRDHGTRMAGFLGAISDNGVGIAGVNWNVRMVPIRMQASNTDRDHSNAAAAVDYAVAQGATISTNSWGDNTFNQGLSDAIDRAQTNGHLLVAAAGNQSADSDILPFYPASYGQDNIIAVAASSPTDELASFSNFGLTSVDLAAPGQDMWGIRNDGTYNLGSGTSSATPHVAGVAALLRSLHPGWTYAQLKSRILATADTLPSLTGTSVSGGRLNAAAAVSNSSIHVSDPSVVEGDPGSTQLDFIVSRRGDTSQPVTLSWSTSDGTAVAGSDYIGTNGQLLFSDPLVTAAMISIVVHGDTNEELAETMFLNLTLDSGTALLADSSGQGTILNDDTSISINDDAVSEGDTTGKFFDEFAVSHASAQFNTLIFGPDGHLYAAPGGGPDTNAILRFDGTTGDFVDTFVGRGIVNGVRDMIFRPDGMLYVAGAYTDQVMRFDAVTGEFVDVFMDGSSDGLDEPDGMAFDDAGNLYVGGRLSNNVLRYDSSGNFVDAFVSSGTGGLASPFGMEFGDDGHLYVASGGSQDVKVYDGTSGALLRTIGSGDGNLTEPRDLTFGLDGYLYVTGGGSDNVARYDGATGTFVDNYAPAGSGGLSDSRSLVFGADNNLYATGIGNNSVLRYGAASQAVFTVSLSSACDVPVTVNYTTSDDSATAGNDYTATAGTLTFASGVTTRTILVVTLDDADAESAETFHVDLSAGSTFVADSRGVAAITDDDGTDPNTLYVSDISFQSRRGGKQRRVVVEIRSDSNADGIANGGDEVRSGVQVTVNFAGQTLAGTTDASGIFRSGWINKPGSGSHYANGVGLVLSNYTWDPLTLDIEDDSDGDGKPDDVLVI